MKRIDAIRVVAEVFEGDPLVMTCGAPARELAFLGRRDEHLYLLDSMGLAGAVGTGLALAGRRPVAAVEGDGSLLMGLSVVSTIAFHRPPGLALIVLDNHEHASADRFPTQAERVDLAAAIRGFDLPVAEAADMSSLAEALGAARASGQTSATVARIEGGNEPGIPWLLEDPAAISARFRSFLERARHETV